MISGLAASQCGAGSFADQFTFTFSGVNLIYPQGASVNNAKIVIKYTTVTCAPPACFSSCSSDLLVANNIKNNAKYHGGCGTGEIWLDVNGLAPYLDAGSFIYDSQSQGCANSSLYKPDVTNDGVVTFSGNQNLLGGWGGGYGSAANLTTIVVNSGPDTWSGNGANQAMEFDIVVPEDVYIDDGGGGTPPTLTLGNGTVFSLSSTSSYFTSSGLGSASSPSTSYAGPNPHMSYYDATSLALSEHSCNGFSHNEHLYRFHFTWTDLGLNSCSGSASIKGTLTGAQFNIKLRQVCPVNPSDPAANIYFFVYHLPDVVNCSGDRMLVQCGTQSLSLQCPGCANQGIESQDFNVHRLTYGYVDADDNGEWDPASGTGAMQPISYAAGLPAGVDDKKIMVGDEFECDLQTAIHLEYPNCGATGSYYPLHGGGIHDNLDFQNGYWYLLFDFHGLNDPSNLNNIDLESVTVDYYDACGDAAYYSSAPGGAVTGTFTFNTAYLPTQLTHYSTVTCNAGPGIVLNQFSNINVGSTNYYYYKLDFSLTNPNITWSGSTSNPPNYFPDGAVLHFHAKFKQNGNAGSDFNSGQMTEPASILSKIYLTLQPETGTTLGVGEAIDPLSFGYLFSASTDCSSPLFAASNGCSDVYCNNIQWYCTELGDGYTQVGYKLREQANLVNNFIYQHGTADPCDLFFKYTRMFELGEPCPGAPANNWSTSFGNFFPYEYRNWDYLSKIAMSYPPSAGFNFGNMDNFKRLIHGWNGNNLGSVSNPAFTYSNNSSTGSLIFDFSGNSQIFNMEDGVTFPNNNVGKPDEGYYEEFQVKFSADCSTPSYIYPSAADFSCVGSDNIDATLDGKKYANAGSSYNTASSASNPYQNWPSETEPVYRDPAVVNIQSSLNNIVAYSRCVEWQANLVNNNGYTSGGNTYPYTNPYPYSYNAGVVWISLSGIANMTNLVLAYSDDGGSTWHNITINGNGYYYLPVFIQHANQYVQLRVRGCITTLCGSIATGFTANTGVVCNNGDLPVSGCHMSTQAVTFTLPSNPGMTLNYYLNGNTSQNPVQPLTFASCGDTTSFRAQVENIGDLFINDIHGGVTLPPGLQLVGAAYFYNGSGWVSLIPNSFPANIGYSFNSISNLFNNSWSCGCSAPTGGFLPGLLMPQNPDDLYLKFIVQATCCQTVAQSNNAQISLTVYGSDCITEQNLLIQVNALPSSSPAVNITPDPALICTPGSSSIALAASGFTGGYAWSPSTGLSATNIYNPVCSATATTNYTVSGTNAAGFSCNTMTTVSVGPSPTPSVSSNSPVCIGQTLNLSETPAYSLYSWTGPNSFVSSVQNPSITSVTSAAAGTYTLTTTSAIGCQGTNSTSVTILALPTPSASNNGPLCVGQTLNLTEATSYTSYSWTGPSSYTSTTHNPSISSVSASNAGTYTVTVTDANGCQASAGTSVTVNALPAPTVSNNGPLCVGQTLNLTESPSYSSYSWTGPSGYTSTAHNPSVSSVTASNAGTYSVTVTDASGCTASGSTTVTVNSIPTSTFTISPNPICVTSQPVTITYTGSASSGATYTWNFAGATVLTGSGQGPYTVSWASGGTYNVSLYVTQNGCTSTTTTNTAAIGSTLSSLWTGTLSFPSNSAPFQLPSGSNPAGGVFSGTGVITDANSPSGYSFDPNLAGTGGSPYTITYTLDGCSITGQIAVTSAYTNACVSSDYILWGIPSSHYFPSGSFTNCKIFFYNIGSYSVDFAANQFTDCDLLFDAGIQVNIPAGAKDEFLTDGNTSQLQTILHGCTNWRGVTSTVAPTANPGYVGFIGTPPSVASGRKTILEDATTGAVGIGLYTKNLNFNIQYSVFQNNTWSVKIDGITQTLTIPMPDDLVLGSDFTTNGTTTSAGIIVNDIHMTYSNGVGINIGRVTATTSSTITDEMNTFTSGPNANKYGIHFINSDVHINNNKFSGSNLTSVYGELSNTVSTYVVDVGDPANTSWAGQPGYASVMYNNFNGVVSGVKIAGSNSATMYLQVYSNYFDGNNNAVNAVLVNSMSGGSSGLGLVDNNYITNTKAATFPVTLSATTPASIRLYTCTGQLEVKNNTITNTTSGSSTNQNRISILIDNSSTAGTSATVEGNTITGTRTGIWLIDAPATVDKNVITIANCTIATSTPPTFGNNTSGSSATNMYKGILMQECYYPNVYDNNIKYSGGGNSAKIVGIQMDNSSVSSGPLVCYNHLYNLQSGIAMNGGFVSNGLTQQGTRVKLNEFNNCSEGLNLWGGNSTTISPQGFPAGTTGYPNGISSDNTWLGNNTSTAPGINCYNFTTSTAADNSKLYFCDASGGSCLAIGTGATLDAASITEVAGGIQPSNVPLINPTYAGDCINNSSYVYRLAGDNSGSPEDSGTVVDEWLTHNVANYVSNEAFIDSSHTEESKWMISHNVFDFLQRDSAVDRNNDTIQQFMSVSLQSNLPFLHRVDSLLHRASQVTTDSSERSNLLNAASSNNAIIVPVDTLETYQQQINQVLINHPGASGSDFSEAERNEINSVSEQCYYQYGNVVLQARVLRGLYETDTSLQYYDDCPGQYQVRLRRHSLKLVSVYPNPSNGLFYFVFSGSPSQTYYVEVFDMFGRLSLMKKICDQPRTCDIDLHNMSAGMYYFKTLDGSNIIGSGKLVLIK